MESLVQYSMESLVQYSMESLLMVVVFIENIQSMEMRELGSQCHPSYEMTVALSECDEWLQVFACQCLDPCSPAPGSPRIARAICLERKRQMIPP